MKERKVEQPENSGDFDAEQRADKLSEDFRAALEAEQLKPREKARLFNQILDLLVVPQHATMFWGDRMLTLDKSAAFLAEKEFQQAFESVRGAHEYDQYGGEQTIGWRLHTLVWAARNGLELSGDFVECGTFQGDMAWVISSVLDLRGHGKDFYLYDTFSGFSDKYSSADDFPDLPGFMEFANGFYGRPGLYESVCDRFAGNVNVKITRGVVPDVLNEASPEHISFLHIDLNSPAAEIGALEVLFDRVSAGGAIVFDDYGWNVFRAQKEAEDRFMFERGYSILELPTGQGLVIKR